MPLTAFVSHPDCARHDTGWKHPDHQGRLPGLVRAVYRDMLTLHGVLLDVEAEPATEEDLLRVHSAEHLANIRASSGRAAKEGRPELIAGEVYVSGASWEAAVAAAGTGITGAREVLAGRARNAFCAARPPGAAAAASSVGGFSLINNVAVAARWVRSRGLSRVLVVEWAGVSDSVTASILTADAGVFVLTTAPAGTHGSGHERSRMIGIPEGSDGALYAAVFEAALEEVVAGWSPELILLGAGFDLLAGDPIGRLELTPRDVYALTRVLVERADRACDGRLVSILEGGYDASSLGLAAVQHLRALTGLQPA